MSPKITQPLNAQDIIIYLANGFDPDTGQPLEGDSPLNRPNVIRSLFMASTALAMMADQAADSAKAEKSSYPETNKKWESTAQKIHDGKPLDPNDKKWESTVNKWVATSSLSDVQKEVLKDLVDRTNVGFVDPQERRNQKIWAKTQDRVRPKEDTNTSDSSLLMTKLSAILANMKDTGVVTPLSDDLVSQISELTWEKKDPAPTNSTIEGKKFPNLKKWYDGDEVPNTAAGATSTSNLVKCNVKPSNAGQPWFPEQDDELRDDFDAGASVEVLAERFGRSTGSIKSRLDKLGYHLEYSGY